MRLLFLTRHDILTFLQPMTGRAVSEAKPPLSGNCAGRHAAAPNRQRQARLGETGVFRHDSRTAAIWFSRPAVL